MLLLNSLKIVQVFKIKKCTSGSRKVLCNERKYIVHSVLISVHRYTRIIHHYFSFLLFLFAHRHSMQRNVMNESLTIINMKSAEERFLNGLLGFFVLFLSFCWDSGEIHVIFCHFTYNIAIRFACIYGHSTIRYDVTTDCISFDQGRELFGQSNS